MEYEMNKRVMGPPGNSSKTMAPHGLYPCAGDDKWVSIAVKTDEEWQGFCRVIGSPEWTTQEKFRDSVQRRAHAAELDEHVAAWTKKHDNHEVSELLQKAGVAAAPMLDTSEIFLDPHMNERKVFVDVEHPVMGNTVLYNWPWKMSDVDSRMQRAPLFGEHNDYVFGEILGISQEEVKRMMEQEVIY
jgi:benzylsuccinate CoA-transferase BbsF subunit